MYEMFRSEVLQKLDSFSADMLAKVAEAMDATAQKYTVNKAETSLSVVGREEFLKIVGMYLVTKKIEGLAKGSLNLMARTLKNFVLSMNKRIEDIRPNDIRAYLYSYQNTRNITNRTLDGVRTHICTFFAWCAAEGHTNSNPAINIKPIHYIRAPRKALTQLELERVRRACRDERELCLVEVLYSTGCRVSELCGIKLTDIDWNKREITVLGKGNKYRQVFINAKAEVAINAYLSVRKHNSIWLMCNDRGGGQMNKENIEKIFRRIKADTNINVTPHIMRHTFATQALTGTGVEVVQQMLGHANIATTMIYAEVDKNNLHAAHLKSVV